MSAVLRLSGVQIFLKLALLCGLGLFLLTRFTSGTLNYYISQRFDWLTVTAVMGLFVVASGYLPTVAPAVPGRPIQDGGASSTSLPGEGGHDHSHALGWVGLALISLPILLGLLVPPRPLGVAALQNREVSAGALDSVLPAAVRSSLERSGKERTILDWVLAFHEGEWPQESEAADVVGFVYHDEEASGERFTVTRFVVGCCAADAMAVGLQVEPGAAEVAGLTLEDGLEAGQWVRVVGRFAAPVGDAMPVLVAERLEAVPEPGQPYLYP